MSVAGGWMPTDLGAALVGWWDFSDAATLFEDTGGTDPVDADTDLILYADNKAGASYNATEATNPPTYKTGIQNSLSVARFDGTNDQLRAHTGAMVSGGTACTVAAVVYKSGNTGDKFIYGEKSGAGPVLLLRTTSGKGEFGVYSSSWKFATTAAALSDGWHILVGVYDASVGPRLYVDGVLDGSAAAGSSQAGSSGSYIGSYGGAGFYNSDIGEIATCNTALSVADRGALEGYWAAAWALTVTQTVEPDRLDLAVTFYPPTVAVVQAQTIAPAFISSTAQVFTLASVVVFLAAAVRTYSVPAEAREFDVAAESRIYSIR